MEHVNVGQNLRERASPSRGTKLKSALRTAGLVGLVAVPLALGAAFGGARPAEANGNPSGASFTTQFSCTSDGLKGIVENTGDGTSPGGEDYHLFREDHYDEGKHDVLEPLDPGDSIEVILEYQGEGTYFWKVHRPFGHPGLEYITNKLKLDENCGTATPTQEPPTETPEPTGTPEPPTGTPEPPTETPEPPTETPEPPTGTPEPPTGTPEPPTGTPEPPTKTPTLPPNTPTNIPTNTPTNIPTNTPTTGPTNTPTNTPTNSPTNTPTTSPTNTPIYSPTPTQYTPEASSTPYEQPGGGQLTYGSVDRSGNLLSLLLLGTGVVVVAGGIGSGVHAYMRRPREEESSEQTYRLPSGLDRWRAQVLDDE